MEDAALTLAELAEQAGVAPRTVRFYIAKGLLSGPAIAGRGAAYTASHLERLKKIRSLQAGGMMLAEIARALDGGPQRAEIAASVWTHYAVGPDLVVMMRSDVGPWRARRLKRALQRLERDLAEAEADLTEGELHNDGNS